MKIFTEFNSSLAIFEANNFNCVKSLVNYVHDCDAKWTKFKPTFIGTFNENFAVMFERFFELNVSVSAKFHTN